MTTSSVLRSPLLSTQLMVTFSPGLPPLNRKCMKGFFDIEVPHCADSTVLPAWVTVTFWMKCAGTTAPFAFLRCPVSISWLISTRTSTLSPAMLARMRIGSAISASAPAEGDLDLLRRVEVLAVGPDHRVDVGGLGHLHAGSDEGIGALGNLEIRRQRVRVLLDQDRDRLRPRDPALDGDRHDGAVLGDVGRGDLDLRALGGAAAAERLEGVGDALGLERRLVPLLREGLAGAHEPRRGREREHSRSAAGLQYFASLVFHANSKTYRMTDFTLGPIAKAARTTWTPACLRSSFFARR